ncbi:MAG: YbbR-like domain-containing protein [Eudoraea sp.]|nr:YbbR-like domain-containing protein [Eudoraea sp.]
MVAKQVLKGAAKRKVKVFVILLFFSFLAWFISKLSDQHTDRATFELVYNNIPDSLFFVGASKVNLTITARGSGWQFLGSRFRTRKLIIDLDEMSYRSNNYFMAEPVYRKQIESKLPDAMTILQMDQDTLFFEFTRMISKKVPVRADVTIDLAQNYLMDGDLQINPDSVVLRGPLKELDTITEAHTEAIVLSDVTDSFKRTLQLLQPSDLIHAVYEKQNVTLSATVFRFSEKIFQIPVEVVNLPEGTQIRTFPNTVEVLCKARVERLKEIVSADFRIIADLADIKEDSPFLPLSLVQQPDNLPSVQIRQSRVEFILKRE